MRHALGIFLVVIAGASIVQSARELTLWEVGQRRYDARSTFTWPPEPIRFGGHTFTVADDLPYDSTYDEQAFTGTIQLLVDGQPLGGPSRAGVRPGREFNDLGRYHLWLDAWFFTDNRSGARELWLTRRLEPDAGGPRLYEVVVADEAGNVRSDTLASLELGRDFRVFRATQLVRNSRWSFWSVFPLSMLDGAIFPVVWLVFPVLPLVLGIALVKPRKRVPGVE